MTQQTLPFNQSDVAEIERQKNDAYVEAVAEEFVRQASGVMVLEMLKKQMQAPVNRAIRILGRITRPGS